MKYWKQLEERFILPISGDFKAFLELALQQSPKNPSQFYQDLGLNLPWIDEIFELKTVDYLRQPWGPPEVFPFAVSVEGETQVGFLSDTGQEPTDRCAIVLVSKTHPQMTPLLASNFREFLSLLILGNFKTLECFPTDEEWIKVGNTLNQSESTRERLIQKLQKLFSIEASKTPNQTLQNARELRQKIVVLESGDGLGVVAIPGNRVNNQPIGLIEATKRLSRKKIREEILAQMSMELDTMVASGAFTAAIASSRNILKIASGFKCGNVLKQITSSIYTQCSLSILSESILCTPYPE
ncbi:MAG: SMI1/KNR4 family protein [Planctomycetota bacterium]